jgi:hypothetical protein
MPEVLSVVRGPHLSDPGDRNMTTTTRTISDGGTSMSMPKIAAAALLVLALAGCSSSPAAPVGAGAQLPTASGSSVSVTPSAWMPAEAGQQYLAMIKPNNAIADEINKLSASTTLSEWQAKLNDYAGRMDTLARGLMAGNWPAKARSQAQTLAQDALAERSVIQEASSATSVLALAGDLSSQTAVFTKAKTDAETMRILLGLPSN